MFVVVVRFESYLICVYVVSGTVACCVALKKLIFQKFILLSSAKWVENESLSSHTFHVSDTCRVFCLSVCVLHVSVYDVLRVLWGYVWVFVVGTGRILCRGNSLQV